MSANASDAIERFAALGEPYRSALATADAMPWSDLLVRLGETEAAWTAAAGRATGEPAPSEWSTFEIRSHVAQALLHAAGALGSLAIAGPARFDPEPRMLPGHPNEAFLRERLDKGWTDFGLSVRTAGKLPDHGATLETPAGLMTPRQFVAFALAHVHVHTQQLAALA